MNDRDLKNTRTAILTCITAGLFVACSSKDRAIEKKSESPQQNIGSEPGKAAQDGGPGNVLALANTTWERCASSGSYGDQKIFKKTKLTFKSSGNSPSEKNFKATQWTDFYSTDQKCADKLTLAEAEKRGLPSRVLENIENIADEKFGFEAKIGAETRDKGVYEFTPDSNNNKVYLLIRITENILETSEACREDYIEEGICDKIDGDSPDNRAKNFKMFKDAVPFKKMKT